MPAILAVSIGNTGATPPTPADPAIDLLYSPQSIQGNLASFADIRGGIPVGFPRLTASLVRPSKGNRNTRVRFRVVQPVLEPVVNVGEAPVLAFENYADITFTMHERSTAIQRATLCFIINGLLGDDTTLPMIVDNDMLF